MKTGFAVACLLGCVLMLLFGSLYASAQPSNGVYREVFFNLTGSAISNLTNAAVYPNSPGFDEVITTSFEAPQNIAESYGQRMRALITPPTTGNYTFWIASDDNGELWLSTDESPTNRQLIATMKSSTTYRVYTKETNQASVPITLIAGQRYYVEALMKEGTGGDNLSVRWQLPGGTWETSDTNAPIPGSRLTPYGLTAPVIVQQPTNYTVVERGPALFSVRLQRIANTTFRWQRNGVDVSGGATSNLVYSPALLSDNGATFTCIISNSLGVVTTTNVTLTVLPDTIAPTISSVSSLGNPQLLIIVFSEDVDAATATNVANYTLSGGLTVLSATFGPDNRTILLTTTPMIPNVSYTLAVSNVKDRAATPNTIAVNAQQPFSITPTPLPVTYLKRQPEQMGPSNRRGPLVISEVMYHPTNRVDGKSLEFIEIYNALPWYEDLSGYRITGAIDFTFPSNTVLGARSYLVVGKVPADVQSIYGISGVYGPWTGSLQNSSGTLRLRNAQGAILFEMEYRSDPPYPCAADGAGHSLVLARPSFGERDVRAWGASDLIGGSPGTNDVVGTNAYASVMVNEFLAHTDLPQVDFIELFNYSTQAVNVGGCMLSDDPATNKFVIPTNTIIPAQGFLVFYETNMNFALSAAGEAIYLRNPQGTRIIDCYKFEAQENGVSMGRYPDGAPTFSRLQTVTAGTNNSALRAPTVVINEVMYDPISSTNDDEYVEIYNTTTNAMNLGKWRLEDGVTFTIPTNTIIPARGYLIIAANAARLRTIYPNLNAANCLGNWQGTLKNSGERIALSMPDDIVSTNGNGVVSTNHIHIVVDEVTYRNGGRWGSWSDGGGSSLELIDPRNDRGLAPSWADSDETAKSGWVNIETTGVMTNGWSTPYQLHITLMGPGECLLDNVEVTPSGGANLITNSTFETGTDGWVFQGNHNGTTWEPSEGYGGGRSLHIRSTGRGDSGANRIRVQIPSTLVQGNTVTLRAKVRWLKGNPNILLRLRGNYLEAPGLAVATSMLGTPGAANTAASTNAPPAITDVAHWPPLPATNQPVLVTARVHDADGLSTLFLRYRIDPAASYVSVAMVNNGAGLFSGTIPGQASNVMACFFIQASDRFGATSLFPNDAPLRECNILWGDNATLGTLPIYRFWFNTTNYAQWVTEEKMSNRPKDVTFVYGTNRIVYNAGAWFHGSPYHSPGYNTPTGNACDYDMAFPDDDKFLGETDINLFRPGNGGSDNTAQSEIHASWWANQFKIPFLFSRPIFLVVNGLRRNVTFFDAQQPNGDFVDQWFSDDADGELHKIQVGFEFGDTAYGNGEAGFATVGASLARFYANSSGLLQQARYRQTFPLRSVSVWEQNSYTNLFTLVNGASTSAAINTEAYTAALTNVTDVEEWYRVDVIQHLYENTDSYSWGGGQNAFTYKPRFSPWKLLLWDVDFAFGNGTGLGTNALLFNIGGADHGPRNDHNPFRRIYWQMLLEAYNTFLSSNKSAPILDARFSGLVAAGAAVSSPNAIKNFIETKRNIVATNLATVPSPFSITSNGGADFSAGTNVVSISGTAPIDVRTIEINGVAYQPVWTSITNWTITLPLGSATNSLAIVGRDSNGNVFSNSTATIKVTITVPVASPVDNVVISEIMFNPAVADAEYLELYNRSATTAFDLTGWTINGLSYTFAAGSTLFPKQYLLLAKDRSAFASAYGSNTVFDTFSGNLQASGETLTLLKPGTPDLVVDRVRYDNVAPWPVTPPGSSVQVIDSAQDNSRVANWTSSYIPGQTNNGWRFASVTGTFGSNNRFVFYPDYIGTVYLDDVMLVAGTNAGAGSNFLRNGNFESPLDTNIWVLGTNMLSSLIVTDIVHSGSGALKLIADVPGSPSSLTRDLVQTVSPSPTNLQVCTLSFWFFVTNPPMTNLNARLVSSGLSIQTNVQITVIPSTNYLTPGTANYGASTLPNFPALWINEVLADNQTGIQDRFGEREPWIELYNAGTNSVTLDGLYLANNYTNALQWAFPTGIVIAGKQFRTIFADGQTNQSTNTELHASFRLPAGVGSVALSRVSNGATQILDYINYTAGMDHSYGSYPDGQAFDRQEFYYTTPGATNNGTLPPVVVYINEWMADNLSSLTDPADSHFDDWFELYNPGTNSVSLGGYYLTDTLTNKFKNQIPLGYSIPAKGYLLVWADGETGQNSGSRSDLHVNFSLSKSGEAIGLFTPDGLQIDAITFGPQTTDLAMGRYPDGSPSIYFLTNNTPRAANFMTGPNTVPNIAAVGDKTVIEGEILSFTATAADADVPTQQLTWSLGAGAPTNAVIDAQTGTFSWRPGEFDGGNSYVLPLIVTDSGVPPLSATQLVTIYVIETNSPPHITVSTNSRTVNEGSLLTFSVSATDSDVPTQSLAFSLDPGSPAGAAINPTNGVFSWTPAEDQGPGFYVLTIRVTDDGLPERQDSVQVMITVNEVNQRPALGVLTNRTVVLGEAVSLQASAMDADLPPQVLTFELPGAANGATIQPTNGLFTWTANVLGTNLFFIRVIDNGTPALADLKPVTIIVTAPLQLNPVTMSNGVITVEWPSIVGRNYRVEYKNVLDQPSWVPMTTNVIATNALMSVTDTVGTSTQRVYRVTLLP